MWRRSVCVLRKRLRRWPRGSSVRCGSLAVCPCSIATRHLSAAVRRLDQSGREDWTQRYEALMQHYEMTPTTNNVGVAHENGDVEQSHYRFQQAVDQALRV